jgi:twitching motility protein PilT
VERIISFFPPHQHQTIRLQLSLVLEGVVSQRLITRRSAPGRMPAVEVLLGTPTVKDLVLEGRTRELPEALNEGHAYYGTQTFAQSLVTLVRDGLIEVDDAMAQADSPDELKLALRGIMRGVSTLDDAGAPQVPNVVRSGAGASTPPRNGRLSGRGLPPQ